MRTAARHLVSSPTRRERQRAATYDEIVTVARQLLGSPDALSLRAIAAEMGLTAPALYRYVDSYNELLMLVARAIFEDVILAMTAARDCYPDDDPAAQILASAAAFRRWALAHPEEFGLIFANAATATSHTNAATAKSDPNAAAAKSDANAAIAKSDAAAEAADAADTPDIAVLGDPAGQGGGAQFSEFFTDIFLRLWDRYRFTLPTDAELEPALLEVLRGQHRSGTLPCDFPGHPLGLSWIFIRSWTRLYGTVTLEVFKHMDRDVIESGALFRAMLDDNARDLGFGDDWPRLRELLTHEMGR